tara:strand:- start:85 stop:216 length:132 start_codon:yes stop_codon:yes gene_type:complete
MKINQFKTNLRKSITSLKIGGTNNTQNKPQKKEQLTLIKKVCK